MRTLEDYINYLQTVIKETQGEWCTMHINTASDILTHLLGYKQARQALQRLADPGDGSTSDHPKEP